MIQYKTVVDYVSQNSSETNDDDRKTEQVMSVAEMTECQDKCTEQGR